MSIYSWAPGNSHVIFVKLKKTNNNNKKTTIVIDLSIGYTI